MKPQGGRFKDGHFGLEVTFARELKRAGLNPAVFKYSRGSTSIARNWKLPGQGGMYDDMASEYRKAVRLLEEQGHTVNARGFIWIQGESDAQTPAMANAYHDRLKALITDMRDNVTSNADLPVILGVDEQHRYVQNNPQVVKAQQQLADDDSHTVFTSMMGLEKADATHLTPKGLMEHGKRIFSAYQQLEKP